MGQIEKKKKEGPVKIQELDRTLRASEEEMKGAGEQVEDHKRKRRQIERDIDVLESRIAKSHVKLSNIKSNKEYQAAIKEIEDLKAEKMLLEDQVLELMEQIESVDKRRLAVQGEHEKLAKDVEKSRNTILKEIEKLDRELENFQKERDRLCQVLDESLLKTYHLLKDRKGGIAISSVIKGVCQGCHLGIPPQKFNELIRGGELMNCPHCRRIIYWGEAEVYKNAAENSFSGMSE